MEPLSDDAKETAKLVKTLTDALPRLAPTFLRQRRSKRDLPMSTSFAISGITTPEKQQTKRGKVGPEKLDAEPLPKQCSPLPLRRTKRVQNPDQGKIEAPEKISKASSKSERGAPKASQKLKAVDEESSGASKKAKIQYRPRKKSKALLKCKFCNLFNTYNSKSFEGHIRLKHPQVYKCKDCMSKAETGTKCEIHLDLVVAKIEASKTLLECPGCNETQFGAQNLKIHAYTCKDLSAEQKQKIRKSSNTGLARTQRERCKFCKKAFYSGSSLTSHVKSEHQDRLKYSCDTCPFVCRGLKNIRAHILRMHKRKNVKNEKEVSTPSAMSTKQLFQKSPNSETEGFDCPACTSTFVNLDFLELHCRTVHPTSFRFVCRLCSGKQKFLFQSSLDKHIESSHKHISVLNFSEETSSLPEEGSRVTDNDHSYASPPSHQKLNELLCSEDTLSNHDWGTLTMCELCDKQFIDEATKNLHFKAFHDRKQEPLPCIICNQIFTNKTVLQIHLSGCRGPKKNKALQAKTAAAAPKTKVDVEEVASSDTIFTCSICKKPFNNLTEHNLHFMSVHSKLTPERSAVSPTDESNASGSGKSQMKIIVYRCNQCSEVFVERGAVLRHLKRRHGAGNVIVPS